jgi:hypothetical protein
MRKYPVRQIAIACIAVFAVLGVIGTTNAQTHGSSRAAGGGFHSGSGFHVANGFHSGGGFGGGGYHRGFHARSHNGFLIGAPVILGPGYYPYGYGYSYGDMPSYWYCRDPAGYYPDVQTCPSGWMQVVPNS